MKGTTMSRGVYAGLSPAACLALTGCGSRGTTAKYRIGGIPKGLTHEFWQSIHRGAEQAANDLGARGVSVEIVWDGPREESDATEQINLIRQMTNMGANGLVLAPQDSLQMVPPSDHPVSQALPLPIITSAPAPA